MAELVYRCDTLLFASIKKYFDVVFLHLHPILGFSLFVLFELVRESSLQAWVSCLLEHLSELWHRENSELFLVLIQRSEKVAALYSETFPKNNLHLLAVLCDQFGVLVKETLSLECVERLHVLVDKLSQFLLLRLDCVTAESGLDTWRHALCSYAYLLS